MTPDGMFSMDMVVRWKGRDVAVEVNGPQHYCHVEASQGTMDPTGRRKTESRRGGVGRGGDVVEEPQLRPLGYKLLRDRLLRSRGFPVANISWVQWERLEGQPAKMAEFLAAVLDDAVQGGAAVKSPHGRQLKTRRTPDVSDKTNNQK